MKDTKTTAPRVLLNWPAPPDYIPPPLLSDQQVTLCPRAKGFGLGFANLPEDLVECPEGDYDLFDFVGNSEKIPDKEFDLVIIWTSSFDQSTPLNSKKFGCPTVLLAGDTHHWKFPVNHLLAYWATEGFDYVATAYNRQHLHWFATAGAENLAWLPLISMRPIAHEWVEVRENQIVFIGQQGSRHPRRSRLVQALKEADFPILIKTANRIEAADRFASSLISFNCSQNGDLNLRNLEVISVGGFLLTDRLSFASGFDELLVPGVYCDTYDSEGELLEKVRYYLDHPQEAIEIARRAYHAFDEQWHPRHRIQNLLDWVFGGELPEPFCYSPRSEVRHFVSTSSAELLDSRLGIYEPIQELHRVQERLKVFLSRNCPGVIAADLLDLPRLELYVEGGFADPCALLQQRGVAERVHELTGEPASWPVFDAAVCMVEDLQRLGQPVKANFAFVLGEDHQLLFTEASRVMETRLQRFTINQFMCVIRLYEETFFYEATYLNFPSFISDISEVKTVIDVGSGIGLASVCFRGFCPDAVIHCFEADPLALHLLQQNALSLGNCHVHPVGLAGQNSSKTRRLWPEDSQTEWGVERVLVFREARTALRDLGLERIDVLRVATGGQEVEVLASLEPWLKDIKVIYVEFCSEQDRKQIDQMLDPSHMIWQGEIIAGQKGSLCYLRRA
ncbi:glycosyltransferase family protein [Synechococcus sp. JA-3-3Ab]|uniref:glycosyltransferase family protein n=1 Tax=Synechococcus sp. (strain JA-3-3Ab) TaxID=321327 RepID=UPI0000694278|nr:glycosyltransferase [Synechococcus sp. JA-3-3Ab]ABC99210.1 methyltransferase, FkbM family [Synechococcus sp. JA-3-3Ab]